MRLLFYADLTLVGVTVQLISLKRPSILDHGPTLIILFRGAMIIFMHFAKLHEWMDGSADYKHDHFNNNLLLIYVLVGFTLVSNFRAFLFGTTPLFLVFIAVHL